MTKVVSVVTDSTGNIAIEGTICSETFKVIIGAKWLSDIPGKTAVFAINNAPS